MKKVVNGVEFVRSADGVWCSTVVGCSGVEKQYCVRRHATLKTRYTLYVTSAGQENVVKHGETVTYLLGVAAEYVNATLQTAEIERQKAESEKSVASVSVSENEVQESVKSLQENLLLSRCQSLSAALKRLDRLTGEFIEFKTTVIRGKKQRRRQGELLLSAVGCLRLSVMTLSAALKQRRDIISAYQNQATRIQQRTEQSRETVLRAKTYQTGGMFKRTETDYNEEKSVIS